MSQPEPRPGPEPEDGRGRSLVPRAALVVGVVVVALAALAVVASLTTSDTLSVDGVAEPDTVPPRDAELVDGGWEEAAAWIRRENADGRPVLVNILASWCGPCRDELPVLLDAYEANPDIAFLGIDHLDRREDAEAFLEEMNVTFPTLFDINGDVASAVEARGMPTTLIFDADGDLVAHHSGLVTASQLEDLLDRVR